MRGSFQAFSNSFLRLFCFLLGYRVMFVIRCWSRHCVFVWHLRNWSLEPATKFTQGKSSFWARYVPLRHSWISWRYFLEISTYQNHLVLGRMSMKGLEGVFLAVVEILERFNTGNLKQQTYCILFLWFESHGRHRVTLNMHAWCSCSLSTP